ncbi:hypothetical protein GGI12_000096 [Dipsacomyces acuminosporus]|nr:hypothetical protein GGI12_000096 [Dipsacomyces acuminosporus]
MAPPNLLPIDTAGPQRLLATLRACKVSKKPAANDLGMLTPPASPMPTPLPLSPGGLQGGRAGISRPVPWGELKQLVDAQNLEPMGRSLETQAAYELRIAEMKHKYGSVANYLSTHALAGFIATADDSDFDPASPATTSDFMLRINDYPYYLGDNVQHWVLWCRKRLAPGFDAPEAAARVIRQTLGQDVEWRYFVNPVAKQSVPQLSHAHVFVKPSNSRRSS